nr:hypothetical protein [Desulfuromonadales bacterium]
MGVRVEKQGDVALVVAEGNFFGGKETDALDKTMKKLNAEENTKMVLDL